MRTAARVDANQGEIVNALRHVGATVHCTHRLGKGYPDLAVLFRGQIYLLEVKLPGEKLTDDEQEWHDRWQCPYVVVVYGVNDALRAVGAIE